MPFAPACQVQSISRGASEQSAQIEYRNAFSDSCSHSAFCRMQRSFCVVSARPEMRRGCGTAEVRSARQCIDNERPKGISLCDRGGFREGRASLRRSSCTAGRVAPAVHIGLSAENGSVILAGAGPADPCRDVIGGDARIDAGPGATGRPSGGECAGTRGDDPAGEDVPAAWLVTSLTSGLGVGRSDVGSEMAFSTGGPATIGAGTGAVAG
jgi:hypothetical protein